MSFFPQYSCCFQNIKRGIVTIEVKHRQAKKTYREIPLTLHKSKICLGVLFGVVSLCSPHYTQDRNRPELKYNIVCSGMHQRCVFLPPS